MSIRAYKIKMDIVQEELFNLWHDIEFLSLADTYLNLSLLNDDCGFIWIEKEAVKKILKEAKERRTKEICRRLLKLIPKNEYGFWVYCF